MLSISFADLIIVGSNHGHVALRKVGFEWRGVVASLRSSYT